MQGFDPQKPLSTEICLHLSQTLDAATSLLEKQPQGRDHAIHKARKQLKAARAALRLTRDFSPKRFRAANRRLAIAARSIAGARDAAAMIECADWLAPYFSEHDAEHIHHEMRARLEDHYRHEVELANNLDDRITSTITLCRITASTLKKVKNKKVKSAEDILSAGWVRRHLAGVDALAACKVHGTDEDFHNLRKATQQTIYQTRLLVHAWPSGMRALEAQARDLAVILGNEHDLTMLMALAKSNPGSLGSLETQHRRLELLESRRAELRKLALKAAKQLFSGYWKNEGKCIKRLWRMLQ